MHIYLARPFATFLLVVTLIFFATLSIPVPGSTMQNDPEVRTDSTEIVQNETPGASFDEEADLDEPERRASYNVIFYLLYRFITNNPLANKH